MRWWWSWLSGGLLLGCGPDGAVAEGDGGESADDGGTTSFEETSTGDADASTSAETTTAIDESSASGSSESGVAIALCLQQAMLAGIDVTGDALVVADVDGDGRPELWLGTQEWDPFVEVLTQHLTAYEASPDGSVTMIVEASFEGTFSRFADIDGDGRDDVVARPLAREESWFWLAGQDDATIGDDPRPLAFPDPLPYSLEWHDADMDGDVDIFTMPQDDPGVTLWLGDGAGGFTLADSIPIDTGGWVERVVPTSEPGVFIADASNGAIGFGVEAALWRLSVAGDGTLSTSAHTEQAPQDFRAARDLDGDDATDLVVIRDEHEIRAWRAVEDAYQDVLVAAAAREVYVGDFVGDGGTQVLVRHDDETVVLLHAPLDLAGAQTPVEGALDYNIVDEIDVDADGRTELLRRDYIDEDHDGYTIVEVVPCE